MSIDDDHYGLSVEAENCDDIVLLTIDYVALAVLRRYCSYGEVNKSRSRLGSIHFLLIHDCAINCKSSLLGGRNGPNNLVSL